MLCVDDEAFVTSMLSKLLSDRWDVSTADSAEEALALIRKGPAFSVVISDLSMPGMDGVAFFSQLRELDGEPMRILLTAWATVETAQRAIKDGHVYRFLTKPCEPDEIREAVHEACERHAERDVERGF